MISGGDALARGGLVLLSISLSTPPIISPGIWYKQYTTVALPKTPYNSLQYHYPLQDATLTVSPSSSPACGLALNARRSGKNNTAGH